MLRMIKVAGRKIARSAVAAHDDRVDTGRTRARSLLIRPMIDASAAFAVLFALALSLGIAPSSASPNVPGPQTYQSHFSTSAIKSLAEKDVQPVVEIAITASSDSPNAVFHRTSTEAAWALLLLAMSMVAALNLALFRHMRQAYTPARRRATQAAPRLSGQE